MSTCRTLFTPDIVDYNMARNGLSELEGLPRIVQIVVGFILLIGAALFVLWFAAIFPGVA
jgi:hypothetical protein